MTFRNRYLLVSDIALILLSVIAAYIARFDTLSVVDYLAANWYFPLFVLAIRLPLFYGFGFYRRLWRYASVNELVAIAEACVLGSVVAAVLVVGILLPLGIIPFVPRSIILIEGMLTLLLIGGLRFSMRLTHSARPPLFGGRDNRRRRVLIFGAGDAGALIVREIHANPALGLDPVAFLDDDASKKGLRIHDVPVLGDRRDLLPVASALDVEAAIIAMPTAPGRVIREIAEQCRGIELPLKTIPGLYEILGGSVKVSAIREVELEDLLRREPVRVDLKEIGRYLGGARVLVTGAGGSIGSELCRQIARFEPDTLVLFELAENHLYEIDRELGARFPRLKLESVVGDVRDAAQVGCIFAEQRPQVVFHAAAHKHVAMSERNVDQVIRNNIIGTRNVLDAGARCGIDRFVLISTDKAVNPRSVMGACKRVGELLVLDAALRGPGVYVAVRFGNVLGSSGSVVPKFKEQIAAGGPVTVTHPEATRYFMTIPEAVSLIVQAAALGKGGEIFVLDMGEPVCIDGLARDLIRLSGFEPGQEIEIAYTGLKPGEKLHEELFTHNEQRQATRHHQIFIAQGECCDGPRLREEIAELEALTQTREAARLRAKLKEIVPEYAPDGLRKEGGA